MRLDPATLATVASLAAAACRPSFQPEPVGAEPTPVTETHRPGSTAGRGAMLAELCLDGLDGRPALAPLVMRGVSWTTERDELATAVARGQVGPFAAASFDGQRAGRFDVLGAADGGAVAIGSYTGAAPCLPGGAPDAVADRACLAARRGCGLAMAPLAAAGGLIDDEREPPTLVVGGACVADPELVVDVDGDGAPERFPLAGFLDGGRAPEAEVSAAARGEGPACAPRFATYAIALPGDGVQVQLDVLGVLDVDGDGWRELVLGLRYPDRKTVAVYSATASVARLSLVGEVTPWEP
ncbi:MAG: hypothetical protein KBG48_00040 [Kofleriaceae bacterium]|jgi:hypothetical protein|nr:hypothetical protein [Kofleriaceae bacterium]MBP9165731.1 hypothetical protein [Kofleriaceae bacterium]MBP9862746.1 hypothetical protein [Kofleriaceae bacterium]